MEESGNLGLSGVIWDEQSYVCIRGGPGRGASPGESGLERGLVGCFGAGREGGGSPALASLRHCRDRLPPVRLPSRLPPLWANFGGSPGCTWVWLAHGGTRVHARHAAHPGEPLRLFVGWVCGWNTLTKQITA